ncbi:MAG TPA: orotate phosphoribosyltransferase [Candidatus Omnitrophota bacterium]|nr:orotate phosphoribosyltransferase [Candidatus Omnitrophota bacterium]HQL41702.1 orotate phosphoribosyltransferase [Candidatus Omnitrophota bacterium]
MSDLDLARKDLFELLYRNAFFREKIILSSGKTSDYYIDARRVTLSAQGAYLSAKVILGLVCNDVFDAIGGPTLGADPLVGAIASLSFQQKKPVRTFIVRKAPKPHGKQQQIEGPLLEKEAHVILIDDVATTGKAFIEALAVMKKEGFVVNKAICLVDRDEGAKEALAQRGCELVSVFNISEFLNK